MSVKPNYVNLASANRIRSSSDGAFGNGIGVQLARDLEALKDQANEAAVTIASLKTLLNVRDITNTTTTTDGYSELLETGGIITINLSKGNSVTNGCAFHYTMTGTAVTLDAPFRSGGAIAQGNWFKLYLDQDATGSRSDSITFTGGTGGFASNVSTVIQFDPTPLTRTTLIFSYSGVCWTLDTQQTGILLS